MLWNGFLAARLTRIAQSVRYMDIVHYSYKTACYRNHVLVYVCVCHSSLSSMKKTFYDKVTMLTQANK